MISFEFLRTVRKPRFWLISLSVPLLIAVVVDWSRQRPDHRRTSGQPGTGTAHVQLHRRLRADRSGGGPAAGGTLVADAAAWAAVAPAPPNATSITRRTTSQPIDASADDLGLFESSRYGAVALACSAPR
ncbi:MAG: hypothetical protein R2719_01730 [Micropruina sp.]